MIEIKVSTRSQFVTIGNQWAQLGSWRPDYYLYEWVGKDQMLIVSDLPVVELFGQRFTLKPMEDEEVNMKDLQLLEKPGTYYRRRKARW